MTVKEAERIVKNINYRYTKDPNKEQIYSLAERRLLMAIMYENYTLTKPTKVTTQKEGGKHGRFRNT